MQARSDYCDWLLSQAPDSDSSFRCAITLVPSMLRNFLDFLQSRKPTDWFLICISPDVPLFVVMSFPKRCMSKGFEPASQAIGSLVQIPCRSRKNDAYLTREK